MEKKNPRVFTLFHSLPIKSECSSISNIWAQEPCSYGLFPSYMVFLFGQPHFVPIAFLGRCPVSPTILGSPLQFRLQPHSFTINLLRSTSQGIQTCYTFPVLKRFLFIGILVQASGTTESCVFLYLKKKRKKEKNLDQSITTILSHGCSDLCVPEWLDP